MIGYIPKYFKLYELFPFDFYKKHFPHGAQLLWKIFDPTLLYVADHLRSRYGRMVCNTWYWGGPNQFRGFRPEGCNVGAPLSMHRFGRALDLVPTETTAAKIRSDIIKNPNDAIFLMIHRVEDDVDWLHIDRANVPGSYRTYFFKP